MAPKLPGAPYGRSLSDFSIEAFYLSMWVVLFLALVILWRLRGGPIKAGLSLAAGTGSAAALLTILVIRGAWGTGWGWRTKVWLGLFLAAQATLVVASLVTYYLLPREPGEGRKLAKGFVAPVILLLVSMLVVPPILFVAMPRRASRSPAVIAMRKLHGALQTYATNQATRSYPRCLEELGPRGRGLIDEALANSRHGRYRFTYNPGPPETSGRISTYALSARPGEGADSYISFFSGPDGVVHWTYLDSAAAENDSAAA